MSNKRKKKISLSHRLTTESKKLLISRNFYIAIGLNLLVLVMTYLSRNISGEISSSKNGVCHEFFYLFYFMTVPELMILASSLSVVGIFCNEWNTGYAKFEAGRMGIKKYLQNKVYICIIGTFITAFISQLIFTIILRTQMPMITDAGVHNLSRLYPFGCIIEYPYIYQFIRIFCFSTFCSMWSCVGLLVSAYIPNKYVVYTTSFVSYYLIERIFNNKIENYVPTNMSLIYLGKTSLTSPLYGNVFIDFIYINVLFIGISMLIGYGFIRRGNRRMRYD